MLRVPALVAWTACLGLLLLVTGRSAAESLQYSQIDQAVVRVMALGLSDTVQIQHEGRTYRFARPVGGHGSGTIVDSSGLILTAAHVVEGARLVSIVLPESDQAVPAEVVFADKEHDFAFVRVSQGLPSAVSLTSESQKLRVRSTVFAIGYPLDASRKDPQSTRGVVSGLLPDGRLQLDISVNPGNSGGPVIDEKERIVGIVVARGDVSQGVTNIAVAVPLEIFRGKFNELKSGQAKNSTDSEGRKKLAAMTKRAAEQGGDWFRNSLEADNAQSSLASAKILLEQASQLSDSADALVLAASYLWNWRVVREARGSGGWKVLERKVVTLCRMASKLESNLESHSSFVAYVLGKLENEPDDPKPFELNASDAADATSSEAGEKPAEVTGRGRYSLNPAASGYSTRTAVGADLFMASGDLTGKTLTFPANLLWGVVFANAFRLGGVLDIGWGGVLSDKQDRAGSIFFDVGLGGELDVLFGRALYIGGAGSGLWGTGSSPYAGLGYRADGVLGLQLDQSADSQFGFMLRGGYTSRGSGDDHVSGLNAGLFFSWNRFPMQDAAWR
jgi:S1-C subfamily serine protease